MGQTDTQANTLIAPYRENYVHRILFFYARNSFESNDQGPAGPDPDGPDGAGPIRRGVADMGVLVGLK